MKKYLITQNATPTAQTDTLGKFNKIKFSQNTAQAKCGIIPNNSTNSGLSRFVYFNNTLSISPCIECSPVPNSLLADRVKAKIEGKGELIHNLKCFGVVASQQNAPNMCEFVADSGCFIEAADEKEETERDGNSGIIPLPVITLVRDYQMAGGVVRSLDGGRDYPESETKPGVTLGMLTANGNIFYTIEPQWWGNEKMISCIPEGEYILKKHTSPKFGECVKIFDVDQKSEVKGRTDILIHNGRWVTNTKGCIVAGNSLSICNDSGKGKYCLTENTKEPVNYLRGIIATYGILIIKSGKTDEIKDSIK